MINNLSSICYLNEELRTAERSAGTLIQYRCRYYRQFEIKNEMLYQSLLLAVDIETIQYNSVSKDVREQI